MSNNKRIKVAQVITRMDRGGSPDIVRLICSYLDPDTYEITLVSGLTKTPGVKTEEFLQSFKGRVIFIPHLIRNINPLLDFIAFIKLYLLFRKEKFQIINTHTAKAGALGRIAAFFAGAPVIIHMPHGHNFYGYFGGFFSRIIIFLEKLLSFITDRIVVMTDLERQDFIRSKVVRPSKLSLIYQGLELPDCRARKQGHAKYRKILNSIRASNIVGMVARLEPVKGPEYFVQAADYVYRRFHNTKFILVGDGSLRHLLERQVEKIGLKENFVFTGWRDDAKDIISDFDVLVLPSLNEAVGIVLLEAQALGVPVVATRVGGIPEIVREGKTGFLVPPRSPRELAQCINFLLENRERRFSMSEAAREWVNGKFQVSEMVREVSGLYHGLLISKSVICETEENAALNDK